MKAIALTLLPVILGCGRPGPDQAPGEYGLVSLTTRSADSARTVNAGVEGTYGTLNIRHGGKVDGELGTSGGSQPFKGTWYFTDTAMILSMAPLGDSLRAQLHRDGTLSFQVELQDQRPMAYLTAMRSDLRNLVSSEESFFADSAVYTRSTKSLNFKTSTGVVDLRIRTMAGAWQATVRHESFADAICGIGVNAENPVDPTAGEGEPACKSPPSRSVGLLVLAWKRVK